MQVRLAAEGKVARMYPAEGSDERLGVLISLETVGLQEQGHLPLIPVLVCAPQGIEPRPDHDVRHVRTGLAGAKVRLVLVTN